MKTAPQRQRIGDEAQKSKTGKTWEQWFKILDRAGADKLNHTAIATYLYDKKGCPGWWCQMVAAGYEQARGLREVHQTTRGTYEISVSRTMLAPPEELFSAWHNAGARQSWLPRKRMTIRKATPHKSLRITWATDQTHVDVDFYPKGAHKTQVTVQHRKLPDNCATARSKAFWAKALARLEKTIARAAAR
jgi:uncharacterized protein YndB with AHSA1/START domain